MKTGSAFSSPWQPQSKRSRERSIKKGAILRVAVSAFNERGYLATSLDDVASTLNVTKATIYHYFTTKEDILYECLKIGIGEVQAAITKGVRQDGTGAERLRTLLLGYGEVALSDFGRCVMRTTRSDLSADKWDSAMKLKRAIGASIRKVISDGIADGSLVQNKVSVIMYTATGALDALPLWYKPSGALSAPKFVASVVSLLMDGLCSNSPAGSQPTRPHRPRTRISAKTRA